MLCGDARNPEDYQRLMDGRKAVMVFPIGKTLTFQWMLVFIAVISVFHQPSGAVVDSPATLPPFIRVSVPRFISPSAPICRAMGTALGWVR